MSALLGWWSELQGGECVCASHNASGCRQVASCPFLLRGRGGRRFQRAPPGMVPDCSPCTQLQDAHPRDGPQCLVTAEGWTLNTDVSPPAATTVNGTAIDLFLFAPDIAATPMVAMPSPSDHHFLVLLAPLASAPMIRRRVRATLWRRVTPTMLDRAVQLLPSSNGNVSAKQLEDALHRIVTLLPSSPWLRSERTSPPLPTECGPPTKTDADAWRLLQAEFRLPAPNTPLFDAKGRRLVTPRQRARGFLRLYAAKHSLPSAPDQRPTGRTTSTGGTTTQVTRWEVAQAMDCLNRRGCADDNGISPQLLLRLRPHLEPLFAEAFSRQLSAADPIPKAWHRATFIPLLKEDKPPNLLDSFRPVALTSLVCRLCERVVAARSLRSLRRPLHSQQFGFVPGRRAELVLAHLLDDALNGFESRTRVPGSTAHAPISHITYAAMVDLSDAFCRVLPQSVGSAVSEFVGDPWCASWILEWFQDRKGRVFLDGVTTDSVELQTGVPQGSVLGPLLFVLVADSLCLCLSEGCESVVAGRQSQRASFALYADDITIWVAGPNRLQVRDSLSVLLHRVEEWCGEQHLAISSKTKTIVFAASHQALQDAKSLPPISVADLTLLPQDDVKLLGWRLDTYLNGNEHAKTLVAKGEKFLHRLAQVARWMHPAHLRSLWCSMVADMLRGSPLWTRRLSAASSEKLESLLAQGCRLILRAVATTRNADVLAEAGFRPFAHMVKELAINWKYRFSCDASAATPMGGTMEELRQLRRDLLPWLPGIAPTPQLDRISFLCDPATTCTTNDPASVRLAANCSQRQRAMHLLGDCANPPLVGWSDGSVVHDGGTPSGGGAALVFLDDRLLAERLVPATTGCCSYSAEVCAALGLVDELCAQVGKDQDVVICSDSRSWITHVACGPSTPGPFAPLIWQSLDRLVSACRRVVVAFMFAHCDDPQGDMVDAAAARARALPPQPTMWHRDAVRPHIEAMRAETDRIQKPLQGLRSSFAPPLSKIPQDLKRQEAVDLCRLRTGVWARLGFEAVAHNTTFTCPKCSAPFMRDAGIVVRHLFECPGKPTSIQVGDLWSADVAVLRNAVSHACTFISPF